MDKHESSISASQLLRHMSVEAHRGIYLLGCLEDRVTVYSQQVRALNLVYALFVERRLQAGDKVAVIGGGVAGVTFVAGAAMRGCHVTLLEREQTPLHLFANCHKRWLHPHVYDWPASGSLTERAGLPVLDWQAAPAADVVERLRMQWAEIQRNQPTLIRVVTNVEVDPPETLPNDVVHLAWSPGFDYDEFKAVIVAMGFGIERSMQPLAPHSYWHDDALEQSDHGQRPSFLISGLGDGGLTDLLRACISDFRHDRVVKDFGLNTETEPRAHELGQQLLAIEEQARRRAHAGDHDGASKIITDAYMHGLDEQIAFLDDAMRARIRTGPNGRQVSLNGTDRYPLTLRASILNRLLAARLLRLGAANYQRGEIVEPLDGAAPGPWQVTCTDRGDIGSFEHVVIRHGTTSALREWNQPMADAFEAELRPRMQLDQTRSPIWSEDFWSSHTSAVDITTPATDAPLAEPAAPTTNFYLPYHPKGEYLVGREGLLAKTRELLLKSRRTAIGQAAAFQGLGGLGKTQLAIDYAYEYRADYPGGVIWIEADNDIDAQLVQLSDKLGWTSTSSDHADKLTVARAHLRGPDPNRLIIFDNLESLEAIEPYLPSADSDAHILVTCREPKVGFNPIPLDLLEPPKGLELLLQEAGRIPVNEDEQAAAREVVDRLDGLPLAIELAGAYLKHMGTLDFRDYLGLLANRMERALPPQYGAVSQTRHKGDLPAALRVSERVLVQQPLLSRILDLLTWSGSSSMGTPLLQAMLEVEEFDLAEACAFGVSLRLLVLEDDGGERKRGKRYRLQRLVQQVRKQQQMLNPEWGRATCTRMIAWFRKHRQDFADLPRFEAELDHLHAWNEYARKHDWSERIELTWLQAYPAHHREQHEEARSRIHEAMEVYERIGMSDPELEGHLSNDLGATYQYLSEHRQALPYHERALELRRQVLPAQHVDVGTTLMNVGGCQDELGRHAEARDNLLQALEIFQTQENRTHPHQALCLMTLGKACRNLGEREEAHSFYQRAVKFSTTVLGVSVPMTAQVISQLGGFHARMGEERKALDNLERAVELLRDALGNMHPKLVVALNELGLGRSTFGYHAEAISAFEEGLAIARQGWSETSPLIITLLYNLANEYGLNGSPHQGVPFSHKALELADSGRAGYGSWLQVHVTLLVACKQREKAYYVLRKHLGKVPKNDPERPALIKRMNELTPKGFRQPKKK